MVHKKYQGTRSAAGRPECKLIVNVLGVNSRKELNYGQPPSCCWNPRYWKKRKNNQVQQQNFRPSDTARSKI